MSGQQQALWQRRKPPHSLVLLLQLLEPNCPYLLPVKTVSLISFNSFYSSQFLSLLSLSLGIAFLPLPFPFSLSFNLSELSHALPLYFLTRYVLYVERKYLSPLHLGRLRRDSLPESVEHPPGAIGGEIPPWLGSWSQPHVQVLIIVPELCHGTSHHLVICLISRNHCHIKNGHNLCHVEDSKLWESDIPQGCQKHFLPVVVQFDPLLAVGRNHHHHTLALADQL